jgi:hypothetical protein
MDLIIHVIGTPIIGGIYGYKTMHLFRQIIKKYKLAGFKSTMKREEKTETAVSDIWGGIIGIFVSIVGNLIFSSSYKMFIILRLIKTGFFGSLITMTFGLVGFPNGFLDELHILNHEADISFCNFMLLTLYGAFISCASASTIHALEYILL